MLDFRHLAINKFSDKQPCNGKGPRRSESKIPRPTVDRDKFTHLSSYRDYLIVQSELRAKPKQGPIDLTLCCKRKAHNTSRDDQELSMLLWEVRPDCERGLMTQSYFHQREVHTSCHAQEWRCWSTEDKVLSLGEGWRSEHTFIRDLSARIDIVHASMRRSC